MRRNGLLITGLVALAVGTIGLAVIAPAIAASSGQGSWSFAPGGTMGMQGMAGMMGGPVLPDVSPIGIERAGDAARSFIAGYGDPNLGLGEVMEFGSDYYAQAVERDTGVHAFELLVDKYSGAVFPEMGPNMVWNTKYGMMGGMMGWRRFGAGQSAEMPIGPERAQELARQYLRTQGLRLDVDEPDRFYGYYTLHTTRDGEVEGMLSVNGYTREVWYHAWHGPFVQGADRRH